MTKRKERGEGDEKADKTGAAHKIMRIAFGVGDAREPAAALDLAGESPLHSEAGPETRKATVCTKFPD
jgi:hypothetical protein